MPRAHLSAIALALCGAALVGTTARADWTAYGGNVENNFYTSEKITAPLGVVWKHATNVYAGRQGNRGGAIIHNDVAYFPSKAQLVAVDADTGELKWKAPEADVTDTSLPNVSATPTTNGELVYVPDERGMLSAYRIDDGSLAWQFRTGGGIHAAPLLVGDNLYFGSSDGYFYCIDARSSDLRWKSNERGRAIRLSDSPTGAPLFYSGVVYVNTRDMKVWAFAADSGRLIWVQRMAAPSADVSPVAYNGRIYVAAGTSMYSFSLRGGNFRPYPMNTWVTSEITTTPVITDQFWFFGDRNGWFYAARTNGTPVKTPEGEVWKLKLEGRPTAAPLVTKDTIFVTTDRGFIYGIDLAQGSLKWTYRMEAPKGMIGTLMQYYPLRAPLAADQGRLYIVGDDGSLTCMSAEAEDNEGPQIVIRRPRKGTVMNGLPPIEISAYVWDEGTGVNTDTVEVLLDGQPIEQDPRPYHERLATKRVGWYYNPLTRVLRYDTPKAEAGGTDQPLSDGPHKITVYASDWRGNTSMLEWNFTADNKLPPRAVKAKETRTPTNRVGAPGDPGQQGGPGGYGPGGMGPGGYGPGGMGGPGGYGGMMGPGGQGGQGGRFRGRQGGYGYQNRGGGGYFGGRGGQGGGYGGGMGGGYGGGMGGGRGGMGGGYGGY